MIFTKFSYFRKNISTLRALALFLILCISFFSDFYLVTFSVYLAIVFSITLDFKKFICNEFDDFTLRSNLCVQKVICALIIITISIIFFSILEGVVIGLLLIYFLTLLIVIYFYVSLNRVGELSLRGCNILSNMSKLNIFSFVIYFLFMPIGIVFSESFNGLAIHCLVSCVLIIIFLDTYHVNDKK
ncbi:hypothetical protein PSOS111911_20710 [Pseudoalteromonas ostreae]